MKTKQIMHRPMGEFDVKQRSDNYMFNATDLLKQWNEAHGMNKEIHSYFKMKSTDELIEQMKNDPDFLHTANSPYIKSRASRGEYAGTWMHPLLFIDFAMWINPKFKLQVLKFVQDKLIEYRHEAGDKCTEMKKVVSRLVSDPTTQYGELMRAINIVVFGRHAADLRQSAQPEELKELSELENFIRSSVDLGLITKWDQLIEMLRKKYRQKYSYAA